MCFSLIITIRIHAAVFVIFTHIVFSAFIYARRYVRIKYINGDDFLRVGISPGTGKTVPAVLY